MHSAYQRAYQQAPNEVDDGRAPLTVHYAPRISVPYGASSAPADARGLHPHSPAPASQPEPGRWQPPATLVAAPVSHVPSSWRYLFHFRPGGRHAVSRGSGVVDAAHATQPAYPSYHAQRLSSLVSTVNGPGGTYASQPRYPSYEAQRRSSIMSADEGLHGAAHPHASYASRQALPDGYIQHAPRPSTDFLYQPHTNLSGEATLEDQPIPSVVYMRPAIPALDGGVLRPGGFDPRLLEEGLEDPDMYRACGIPPRMSHKEGATKRVELWRGNLVLDCPIPPRLLEMLPNRTNQEFTFMRYTACTADPNRFAAEEYVLRPSIFQPQRRIELMICLTMYNEDDILFANTLHAVMRNISYLSHTPEWGQNAWKRVVVVIVADGRLKVNERTLAVLASLGLYQEGVPEKDVNGVPVTAHIFEYTTQFSMDAHHNIQYKNITPVQVILCLKEKNQKKINSHRWFFVRLFERHCSQVAHDALSRSK